MRIGSAWTCRILDLALRVGGGEVGVCPCCTTLLLLAGRAASLASPGAGCAGCAGAVAGIVALGALGANARGVLNGFIGSASEGFSSCAVMITTNLLQNWNSWLNFSGSSHLAISLLTLNFEPSSE